MNDDVLRFMGASGSEIFNFLLYTVGGGVFTAFLAGRYAEIWIVAKLINTAAKIAGTESTSFRGTPL